ncbi:MAG: acyl carrier protein [Paenibacillaceae bacterium]|nr:acyl carrier protein [Paenibacillaceae bacterium]
MSQREHIIEEVRALLSENLELEVPEMLKETDRLYEDLQVDSIMSLQLTVYIEEVFKVTVPEEELDQEVFKTVGSLVDFIEALLRVASNG